MNCKKKKKKAKASVLVAFWESETSLSDVHSDKFEEILPSVYEKILKEFKIDFK